MSRLQQLDALRGIAALMVAASHFNALVLGGGYILGAGLAVDFFFMFGLHHGPHVRGADALAALLPAQANA